jgi:hypothetical protein
MRLWTMRTNEMRRDFFVMHNTPMSRLEGPIKVNSLSADNQIQSSVD